MKEKSWKPWALLAPSLTAVFLLLVVPVCFVVVYSFWLRAPSGSDIPAFQFGNYAKFFADFFYPSLLIRTIRVALETVVLCLVMGYIPAYFFYRSETRFKSVLLLLIMLPFWISFIFPVVPSSTSGRTKACNATFAPLATRASPFSNDSGQILSLRPRISVMSRPSKTSSVRLR